MPEEPTALITDPIAIFTYLAVLVGGVFILGESNNKALKKFFHYAPPLIWTYFLPMISTTLGIIPNSSSLYSFIGSYILPVGLLLLLLSANVPATLRLGPKALFMFFAGTIGVVAGAPIALAIFQPMLPDETWTGVAALAGSWIGGSANMAAMVDAVKTPSDILAPIIVVDTVVGYGWMGIMIALSGFQEQFDKWNKADNRIIKEVNESLGQLEKQNSRPTTVPHLLAILGLGFGLAYVIRSLSSWINDTYTPESSILSTSTWTIMIVSAVGIALSFTRVRQLESYGASKVGYTGIYLLLATIGAKANLLDVVDSPAFILLGVVWLSIHVLILFIAARIMKAPMFFVAVGSQANIGGTSSAPVVASVFQPSLAPVGLLMGIVGNVVGTYGAMLTAAIAQYVSGFFF